MKVSGRPYSWRTNVGDENRVIGREPVDSCRDELWVQRRTPTPLSGKAIETSSGAAIVRRHAVEVLRVAFHGQQRQQCINRVADRAGERDLDGHPAADLLSSDIDLDHWDTYWVERAVRKVRPEHQQRVTVLHRPIARTEADEPSHANVVWVVVLDELLPAKGVDNRRLECCCDLDELVMRASAAGSGQYGHAVRPVQDVRGGRKRPVVGPEY